MVFRDAIDDSPATGSRVALEYTVNPIVIFRPIGIQELFYLIIRMPTQGAQIAGKTSIFLASTKDAR
jgi:hypothetical protein